VVSVSELARNRAGRRFAVEFEGFSKGTSAFLADLAAHNDRAWFAENRARYEAELLERQRLFVDAVGGAFAGLDPRVQCVPSVDRSIFRINRDTRFSHDKSPYKTHSDLWFWIGNDRKTAPGYFMRIHPAGLWVGCGAHRLEPGQLARLRGAIVAPASGGELQALLGSLATDGYEVGEATLKRVPAGFSADAPRAELLRYTVVHAIKKFEPAPVEFESAAFVPWCMGRFERVKPLVDWLVQHVG
jgi:uncharacterized protein (TIGR02453 family)